MQQMAPRYNPRPILSLAIFVNLKSKENPESKITVLCHDTIFANTLQYILDSDAVLCWIPNSLTIFFIVIWVKID